MFTIGARWRRGVGSLVVAFCIALAAGCETQPSKEAVGTGVGGLIGGLVGAQFGSGSGRTAATIGGVIIGGLIGNVIGKRMDEDDRRRMSQALDANTAGQPTSWQNSTTGASYTVTPGETFTRDGRQCRTFTQEAIIDGEPRQISGTACRRPDGATWETT
jgi:surface antigen